VWQIPNPHERYRRAIRSTALAEATAAVADANAVVVDRVTKDFRIPREPYPTVRGRVAAGFRRQRHDLLHALDGVSFDVRQGEFFGVVGRNGSGKSTLLKCIAGIYDIDSGDVGVAGRLAPFVELGAGFDAELTGRDNVFVNAVMLGLTRRQARERFDDVIAFGELQEFVDLKLKNYSSGMSVRLSFSVATQVDADVLLIDEVLAVGDEGFQRKCFGEFERLKRQGCTILFVTHDMSAVERFCDRALLLDRGRVVDVGEPAAIARSYRRLNARGATLGATIEEPGGDAASPPPEDAAPTADPRLRRHRPVALGDDPRRFADIAHTLARMEFKLHYHGSVLGYVWAVMRPLMLFGVTYFVFTHVGSFNRGVQDYAVYLLTSIVLWTFFAEATTGAASSLLKSQDLLRKLRFPRLAVPLSVVLKAAFNLGANLIAVVVLVAISGVEPRLTWLELPLLVVLLIVLATGIGTLVSALFVRFRDVAQIWAVLAQLLFLGSSVLYVVTQFPPGIQRVMVANPLAMIFTQMRHALIDPSAPSAAAVAGGNARLLIPLGVTLGIFALGLWVFARESRQMAENL
jgi:ABC-type polysaccharide/polyol phosphate transport system ATPase subunit/ABC-type polysaccharide/polyol phosphate export permease